MQERLMIASLRVIESKVRPYRDKGKGKKKLKMIWLSMTS